MAQLYFYYSAMNAGKSTTLLQSAFNYRERGMRPMIMTAAIDDPSGVALPRELACRPMPMSLTVSLMFALIQQQHQIQPVNCVGG